MSGTKYPVMQHGIPDKIIIRVISDTDYGG
jgi:hypothetical protein